MGKWRFCKYHGIGNDFILKLVKNEESNGNEDQDNDLLTPLMVQNICNRHTGIGADGIIFVIINTNSATTTTTTTTTGYQMKILNSDGSLATMCGNGLRCLVKFLYDYIEQNNSYVIQTDGGIVRANITSDGLITISLDPPQLFFQSNQSLANFHPIPIHLPHGVYEVIDISLGNPHAVTFVPDLDLFEEKFPIDGKALSTHEYFPTGVNAEFVQVINSQHLHVRVWERGAGPTLACGTGACAAVIASVLMGFVQKNVPCKVTLPGGDLWICWRDGEGSGGSGSDENTIQLSGPAQFVYEGTTDLDLFRF